jgi:hypothetical protein
LVERPAHVGVDAELDVLPGPAPDALDGFGGGVRADFDFERAKPEQAIGERLQSMFPAVA